MFENIFETIVKGSNTVFLDMPEEDYVFSYGPLSIKAAQDLADNYFLLRSREGVPHVTNISSDPGTHSVKITLEVDHLDECNGRSYSVPDTLNIDRQHE